MVKTPKIFRILILVLIVCGQILAQKSDTPLNVILITADDLGYEAVNSFGRTKLDLTPQLDAFAKEGVQFAEGHTATPICQPSRAVMATGLYSVSNGMMGFIHRKKPVATAMEVFRENGYLTGCLGKLRHSTPPMDYIWDFAFDMPDLGSGRSPKKYAEKTKAFLERSKAEGKPFYLMINSHDPHRPYHDPNGKKLPGQEDPSKLFSVDEVEVPKYMPPTDQVKLELSFYYNSVRRFDDTFGAVMKVIKDSGFYENSIIVVLSDNGSAFPFAKANTYVASSKTLFYVHYPGHMKPGLVDEDHLISEVDIFPTFLEASGVKIDQKLDGMSFLPLLQGKAQKRNDFVITQIDYKAGGNATPMRSYGDKEFRYIFNPWSPTGDAYKNNNEGKINKDIEQNHPEYLRYVEFFRHRTLEEFYDVQNDPDATRNLIDDPKYKDEIEKYRKGLKKWMKSKNDPVLVLFEQRNSPEKLKALLADKEIYPTKLSLMPPKQYKEQELKDARNMENKK
jgi:N-sulfoglucosamine sulfohydrolase